MTDEREIIGVVETADPEQIPKEGKPKGAKAKIYLEGSKNRYDYLVWEPKEPGHASAMDEVQRFLNECGIVKGSRVHLWYKEEIKGQYTNRNIVKAESVATNAKPMQTGQAQIPVPEVKKRDPHEVMQEIFSREKECAQRCRTIFTEVFGHVPESEADMGVMSTMIGNTFIQYYKQV